MVTQRNGLTLTRMGGGVWRVHGTATAPTTTLGAWMSVDAGRYRLTAWRTDTRIRATLGDLLDSARPATADIDAGPLLAYVRAERAAGGATLLDESAVRDTTRWTRLARHRDHHGRQCRTERFRRIRTEVNRVSTSRRADDRRAPVAPRSTRLSSRAASRACARSRRRVPADGD